MKTEKIIHLAVVIVAVVFALTMFPLLYFTVGKGRQARSAY
jgi:hypothetical protein